MTNGNFDFFNRNDEKDRKIVFEIVEIIKTSIKLTKLDLSGLTVLTEAATGYWTFTPFVAAFAKADSVICITKDSKYGTAEQIISNFSSLTSFLNMSNKIDVFKKNIPSDLLQKIDIVTNSGHVRPIDKKFIKSLKSTCVISLMWEPWEYRQKDLDLSACWQNKICVMGVNEQNKIINIMKYNGKLLEKILKNNNITIKNKKVILIAENVSALYMLESIVSAGAKLFCISKTMKKELEQKDMTIIGSDLNDPPVEDYLKNSDLIIINSAPLQNLIICGNNGINPSKLKTLSPNVVILVFFGSINYDETLKSEIHCIPSNPVTNGHLNWTLEFLGPKPVIELAVLGFKAVEKLAKCRKNGIDYNTSMNKALAGKYSLDFSLEQKKMYSNKN